MASDIAGQRWMPVRGCRYSDRELGQNVSADYCAIIKAIRDKGWWDPDEAQGFEGEVGPDPPTALARHSCFVALAAAIIFAKTGAFPFHSFSVEDAREFVQHLFKGDRELDHIAHLRKYAI
jgi:hypothetical protein